MPNEEWADYEFRMGDFYFPARVKYYFSQIEHHDNLTYSPTRKMAEVHIQLSEVRIRNEQPKSLCGVVDELVFAMTVGNAPINQRMDMIKREAKGKILDELGSRH